MLHFKLKPGLTFAAEGSRYLVHDPETESKFRIGEWEYQILKQFEEKTNLEEVRYLFRTKYGREVPFTTLRPFVHEAIKLNILEMETGSFWSKLGPSTAFTYQFKLFDPSVCLNFLLSKCAILFGRAALTGALLVLGLAMIVLIGNRNAIFTLHAGGWLGFSLVNVGFFVFAFGHEMAHGLAAKKGGLVVSSIGFHLHYFMPSLNCKILRPMTVGRQAVLKVLVAGSFFDALCAAGLTGLWLFWPARWLAMLITVVIIKICLVQLNPFWPYSDGYHIVGLWFGKRLTALFRRKREHHAR